VQDFDAAIGDRRYWFHSIELPDGRWTNGHKSREQMLEELHNWQFPEDLNGKTVLDIGCNDGEWSAYALKRGAASVLGIDEDMTAGMRLLQEHKIFPKLTFRQIDLFSTEFLQLPVFDFVIFTGVLYHVEDVPEALRRVRAKTKDLMLIETHINHSLGTDTPYMVYYPNNELAHDASNWWGPNLSCLEALLRRAGFTPSLTYLTPPSTDIAAGRAALLNTPIQEISVAFDGAASLRANPDVAASGVDPRRHYEAHGRYENRPLR
jgi:tRNA (mo5U34)-methyltransferase